MLPEQKLDALLERHRMIESELASQVAPATYVRLSREFAEELSIDVALSAPIDSYLFEVIPGRHVFIVTYGCTLVGEFRLAISHEHAEHCLWPVERLSELNLPVGYRRSIEKWANTI